MENIIVQMGPNIVQVGLLLGLIWLQSDPGWAGTPLGEYSRRGRRAHVGEEKVLARFEIEKKQIAFESVELFSTQKTPERRQSRDQDGVNSGRKTIKKSSKICIGFGIHFWTDFLCFWVL